MNANSFRGRVLAIAIAPEAKGPTHNVDSVQAVPGQGLAGDRYGSGIGASQFKGRRKPENEVSLIDQGAILAANEQSGLSIQHLETRRNLLTEGVPLNDLVGKTFRVGSAVLKGIELCEPCGYLERRTYPGIMAALKHRGGLRCRLLEGGQLHVGDEIVFVSEGRQIARDQG
jgi:MOSC domain-containing protein YiiM